MREPRNHIKYQNRHPWVNNPNVKPAPRKSNGIYSGINWDEDFKLIQPICKLLLNAYRSGNNYTGYAKLRELVGEDAIKDYYDDFAMWSSNPQAWTTSIDSRL